MKIAKSNIVKHIFFIAGITGILTLCIAYPFLPGEYDVLAMPISIMVQSFGVLGLTLSIVGIFWLIIPGKHYLFEMISLYVGTLSVLMLSLVAFFTAGKALGILTGVIGIFIFIALKKNINASNFTRPNHFYLLPLYMTLVPVLMLVIQIIIAKPLTRYSRSRAIVNANEYIADLNGFYAKNGHYPNSIQALHKDYNPGIAGIDKYHYLLYGKSYNLSFEQPRFLLDVIGTREWVVYNPTDEQRAYSHASWFLLLSPLEVERSQGWYTSGTTEHAHWRYFWFD